MSPINCSEHGLSAAIQVCEHIHAELSTGHLPGEIHTDPVFWIKLCAACYGKIDFEKFKDLDFAALSERTDAELEEIEDNLNASYLGVKTSYWCRECYRDIQSRS